MVKSIRVLNIQNFSDFEEMKVNSMALAKKIVFRAIRKKYPEKPFEYHMLQSRIYWNEVLF